MSQPTILYRPEDGWFGDVMPIYADGDYHLFYTFLSRHDKGAPGVLKGLDWAHVVTRDFVTYEEMPIAIRRGGEKAPDLLVGSGSVVRADNGEYVAFYSGINPVRGAEGAAEQVVLRATSQDMVTWQKDPDFLLEADPRWYERNDWRDPWVFKDGDRWVMLLCARVLKGPFDRRGCVGIATSTDLVNWETRAPMLAPGTTYAPECPEVFELGGHTYLLYSTYSDRFASRYRIGTSAWGPWRRPPNDALESNDVYAINTVSDGTHRYAIGWLSTRAQGKDSGHRQWGGDLVVHELTARADGTLGTVPLPSLLAQFEQRTVRPEVREGSWTVKDGETRFQGPGFGWCSLGEVGERALLDVTVDLSYTAEEVGVAIRAASDFGSSYLLRLEPERHRVVFDRRPHRIDVPFEADSDRSYVSAADHEIERPLRTDDGPVRIRIMVDGSAIVSYIDDVALSTRGYDLKGGEFAVYATNGSARFSGFSVGDSANAVHPRGVAASSQGHP